MTFLETANESIGEEEILKELRLSVNCDKLSELGIPQEHLPLITRGLPELTKRRHPKSVQNHFSDVALLKRLYIDSALLHLYSKIKAPQGAHVVILSWVIGDGLGDYAAQRETARILTEVLPEEAISLVTFLYKEAIFQKETLPFPQHVVRYTDLSTNWKRIVSESINPTIDTLLKSADFILQIPTYYPNTHEIMPKGPKYELVGEGGWLDTPHFHPLSDARCMGLHYLEKGIFIKKMPSLNEAPHLLNKRLSKILFRRELPSKETINSYSQRARFNSAYTYTDRGLYLYLHMLLKWLENDKKNCDIAIFDLNHLLQNMETLYLPLFKKTGIREVAIFFEESVTTVPVSSKGKTLRLIHLNTLSHAECLPMTSFTQDLVGCRGDGSLSEAVSANKPFFLDPPSHKRELIKDLIALATTHLPARPNLAEYLNLHLNTSFSLQHLGDTMGSLLQNPEVTEGMVRLNQILQENYAVNPNLQNLTLRALFHHKHPNMEILEKSILDEYLYGDKSGDEVLREIKETLNKCFPKTRRGDPERA